MAIKVNNVTVIDDSRNATVVNASANSLTYSGTNVLATAAEINQLDGVTDNVQTQIDSSAKVAGTLDRTFSSGETVSLTLSNTVSTPVVSVTKEVPQTEVTSNDWDVAADGSNFTLHDTAYDTTLTPSNATGNGTFTLGTGSFAAEDVGKRIIGNGGEAVLTAADGSYELRTAFNDSSTIAAGDWSMFALDIESADVGLTLSGIFKTHDIENASYDSVSFSVSGQDTRPNGIAFNTDGTKMYMVGRDSNSVYQYNLSTAFDLSTANYNNVSFSVQAQDTRHISITFNANGTRMYTYGDDNDSVFQYRLNTPFDLSTANYNNESFSVQALDGNIRGLAFSTDGTKMYVSGTQTDSIYQHTLGIGFDVSTASYDNVSFDVSGQGSPNDITFNQDGTKMYTCSSVNGGSIFQYTLNTAFDLSTASYDNIVFSISGQEGTPQDVAFSTDGTKMYVVGNSTDSVYQYTTLFFTPLPTNDNHTAITSTSIDSEFWTDINSMTADDSVNDGSVYYAVSTDDRTTWSIIDDTNGVRNIVRNNGGTWEINDASDYGTETWVAATENDEFYALEEAVELSTAQVSEVPAPADQWSYDNVSFDVSGQDSASPFEVLFNDDGTKMYIGGYNTNSVYQYSLSSPFDLSSVTYDNVSLNVNQGGLSGSQIFAITFNNDGTKLYSLNYTEEILYQYALSTAYDLSTASYDLSFNVSEDSAPYSVKFNDNGTKMFILGQNNKNIYQYSLSTPFDISTASYDDVSYNINAPTSGIYSLSFSNDGFRLFIGSADEVVYQYSLSIAYDITTTQYDGITFSVANEVTNLYGISFNNDSSKMYASDNNSVSVYQYTTGSTTSTNRMDSTQLNAVSDANHYTLGNDLDLAITLFMADGNTASPTSDGVSINYDGNVVEQGAVLGTDYEFDAPATDTVRIKNLSASSENYKVKVI